MSLNAEPSYPARGHFVLKLHRDARPERGELVGRIERICSGRTCEFRSAEQLLACLAHAAEPCTGDPSSSPPDRSHP